MKGIGGLACLAGMISLFSWNDPAIHSASIHPRARNISALDPPHLHKSVHPSIEKTGHVTSQLKDSLPKLTEVFAVRLPTCLTQ